MLKLPEETNPSRQEGPWPRNCKSEEVQNIPGGSPGAASQMLWSWFECECENQWKCLIDPCEVYVEAAREYMVWKAYVCLSFHTQPTG